MMNIVEWLRAYANRKTIIDLTRFNDAAARIEQLEAALQEISTYEIEDGCPCNACQHSAIARAALEEPK